MWEAMNADEGLLREVGNASTIELPHTRASCWCHPCCCSAQVLGVLDTRFWFVGILEDLDLSMATFCALGAPLSTPARAELAPTKTRVLGQGARHPLGRPAPQTA